MNCVSCRSLKKTFTNVPATFRMCYKIHKQRSSISEVQKAIYDRLEMPEAFEKVRSGKQRQYPYYRIYVKNYTILYVVIGNIMEVRHMFYSRRDIQNLI